MYQKGSQSIIDDFLFILLTIIYLTNKDFPFISSGLASPKISNIVGAISDNFPSSNLAPATNNILSTLSIPVIS